MELHLFVQFSGRTEVQVFGTLTDLRLGILELGLRDSPKKGEHGLLDKSGHIGAILTRLVFLGVPSSGHKN